MFGFLLTPKDVVLVCDPAKLANGKYVDGAPDLTVEVISPSTGRMDRLLKRDLYERCRYPALLACRSGDADIGIVSPGNRRIR